jgi:hypothetical protein
LIQRSLQVDIRYFHPIKLNNEETSGHIIWPKGEHTFRSPPPQRNEARCVLEKISDKKFFVLRGRKQQEAGENQPHVIGVIKEGKYGCKIELLWGDKKAGSILLKTIKDYT